MNYYDLIKGNLTPVQTEGLWLLLTKFPQQQFNQTDKCKLIPEKSTELELKGQEVFFGKGRCAECHPPPFDLDNQMQDLHLERFFEPETVNGHYGIPDGPIKTFTLRGIKPKFDTCVVESAGKSS